MKIKRNQMKIWLLVTLQLATPSFMLSAAPASGMPTNMPIPWGQIGAKVGADYHGDGLAVTPTAEGARLHCVFQRMDGEATGEGLWLTSTVTNQAGDHFQVKAVAVGNQPLPQHGVVVLNGQTVQFKRIGLMEEYSVSMDGVRQDFVVTEKPRAKEGLKVELTVAGAKVEQTTYGAQLVLEQSGRKIAYSRLRATDATGRELSARMEVFGESGIQKQKSDLGLAIVVNDAGAVYPVRIDPTFSDANWVSLNTSMPGTDGQVNAAVVDGSGNLYIGGQFTIAGGVIASNIANWNGSSWSALGSGMNNFVYALAVSGGTLYVGGAFTASGDGSTNLNYVAQWNGSSWSALGSGVNNQVEALAVSGGTLYAGGFFTASGDGSTNLNGIAQWNGSSWSALGSGMSSGVYALAVSGTTIYAGGTFSTAGGNTVNYIAQWNGSSWSALGSGMGGSSFPPFLPFVRALAVSGTNLYAGGFFTASGDGSISLNHIAQWNGSSWSPLGSGLDNDVYVLAVSGTNLYAGGTFGSAGGNAASGIAQWNGSSWSASGSGMGGTYPYVFALAVSGTSLYAGGKFTATGDGSQVLNYIAQWNGSSWSPLGSGINGNVEALAVSGGTLYAGGNFTTAGGIVANSIAQWNGSSWSALGSGMMGGSPATSVSALAVSGGTLYVGGSFTTAGGIAASNIAQWNGSSWSALGSGMGGQPAFVYALAVSGTNLYAGGGFTTAGGNSATYIAQWNGSSWSALGSGMSGYVSALAVSGTNLYAGGFFSATADNSQTLNCIAQWNGSSWSALGSGMSGYVYALAVSGTNLYAGGFFNTAGGNSANYIAQWNGSNWSALGSGLNNDVYALAASGNALYVGGSFTLAGGKVSPYMAEAILPSVTPLAIVTTNNLFGFANQQFRFTVTGPVGSNVVVQASTNFSNNWISLLTNPLTAGSLNFTDTLATNYSKRFYRAHLQ
jgi:hypothetical protein